VGPQGGNFCGRSTTGETWITRRQYLRMARGQSREQYTLERRRRAVDAGFRPTNQRRYWSMVDAYRAQEARKGHLMGRLEASQDPEFKAIAATITDFRRKEDREKRGPGGRVLQGGPDRT